MERGPLNPPVHQGVELEGAFPHREDLLREGPPVELPVEPLRVRVDPEAVDEVLQVKPVAKELPPLPLLLWGGASRVPRLQGDEGGRPELLAFRSAAPNSGVSVSPWEALNTVTFEVLGPRRTSVTVAVEVVNAPPEELGALKEGFRGGWGESFERLQKAMG